MHASNIKSWNSLSGDYATPDELNYSQKYELAKKEERGFVNRLSLLFVVTAIGAVIVLLEVITRV